MVKWIYTDSPEEQNESVTIRREESVEGKHDCKTELSIFC